MLYRTICIFCNNLCVISCFLCIFVNVCPACDTCDVCSAHDGSLDIYIRCNWIRYIKHHTHMFLSRQVDFKDYSPKKHSAPVIYCFQNLIRSQKRQTYAQPINLTVLGLSKSQKYHFIGHTPPPRPSSSALDCAVDIIPRDL